MDKLQFECTTLSPLETLSKKVQEPDKSNAVIINKNGLTIIDTICYSLEPHV